MTGPVIPPLPPGEPEPTVADPHALLSGYLDYHRAALLRKLDGLSEDELRGSRLPSGWAPLELLRHLTYVERRWLSWGFAAEPVPDPWGDHAGGEADGRWYVPEGTATEEVFTAFHEQCARSRSVVAGVPLGTRARTGGRFPDGERAPSLAWILFHLLQEYGRHLGHLDVARELADGSTGE
ncbi:DinB family protein [Streptomyces sp. NPDC054796]